MTKKDVQMRGCADEESAGLNYNPNPSGWRKTTACELSPDYFFELIERNDGKFREVEFF